MLSGGRIHAARHRVRRVPSVRRLSAVLFVAPDMDERLAPQGGIAPVDSFSDRIMQGGIDVNYFKEVMGKRWRYREGNEDMGEQDESGAMTQDEKTLNGWFGVNLRFTLSPVCCRQSTCIVTTRAYLLGYPPGD